MKNVSTDFQTASLADTRYIVARVTVQWDGENWSDETDVDGENNLISFRFTRRIEDPVSGAQSLTPMGAVDVGTVKLRNRNNRYSPWQNGGDDSIRAYLQTDKSFTGKPIRIDIGLYTDSSTVEYVRVFTGYIFNGDVDGKECTLHIRDNGFGILQHRLSTPLIKNTTADEFIKYLAESAGIATGDMNLDASPHVIPFAWLDDDAVLKEMSLIAAASGGRVYFDSDGVLTYLSLATLAVKTEPDITLDAGDFQASKPLTFPDLLADKIVIEYSPRVYGNYGVLHTLDEERQIEPGDTESIEIRMTSPAYFVTTPEAEKDYWIISSGGIVMHDYITVSLTQYAQRVTVDITNSHETLPALVVFFQLRGLPIIGGPTKQTDRKTNESMDDADVQRVRSVRGNEYLQTEAMALSLRNLLADRHRYNVPKWTLNTARGLPQLEIGDRIAFYDALSTANTREGFVIEIATSYNTPDGNQGQPLLSQNITFIDAEKLFPYSDYFVIGETTLGDGRAWY